jgi:hypothetical protein
MARVTPKLAPDAARAVTNEPPAFPAKTTTIPAAVVERVATPRSAATSSPDIAWAAKLDRAHGILHHLMRVAETRPSERTIPGEIDPGRLLRGYYPVLEIGRRILEKHPVLARALLQFLDGVSIPAEVRVALYDAVGLVPIEPEPPTPLDDPVVQRLVDQSFPDYESPLLDDRIRDAIFGAAPREGWHKDLTAFMGHSSVRRGDSFIAQLRIYARAREINTPDMRITDLRPVLARLPRTREAIAVLGRLLAAHQIDPKTVVIDGVPLPMYWPPQERARSCTGPLVERSQPMALDEWQQTLNSDVGTTLDLDDEAILRLWTPRFYGGAGRDLTLSSLFPAHEERASTIAALHLASRTR